MLNLLISKLPENLLEDFIAMTAGAIFAQSLILI